MIEVTETTFQQQVLDKSAQLPVLVDFWAAWCAPCRMLMPVLSQLEEKLTGKFVLAKVNTDEQKTLAGKYGIRSLPTLKLFHHGKVVEEMMGVRPESELADMLYRYIPRESDSLRVQALQHAAAGATETALRLLRQAAATDPDNNLIPLDMAQIHLQCGQTDAAENVLRQVRIDKQSDAAYKRVWARVQLNKQLPQGASIESLRQEAKAGDWQSRIAYAVALAGSEDYRGALDILLQILGNSAARDPARAVMVQIFDIIAGEHPEWVAEFRGKMFRALH